MKKHGSIEVQENNLVNENIETKETNEDSEITENKIVLDENLNEEEKYDWGLKIPKIDLYAEISEGTDDETLEKYIGHFENSEKENGNVCLMAHNIDYNFNYFERLEELEEDDDIYYIINNKTIIYKVYEILVIYESDESMFDETKDDRLTLVTEIKNRENYRLCVQAIKFED